MPPLKGLDPNGLVPSLKAIVPDPEDTVAVRVTFCPGADGFGVEVKAVVLLVGLTVWLRTGDVLLASLASPP
jgi:hypothetical protein